MWGDTKGLKADQIRRLENLYRRRIPPDLLISQELCRDTARLSHEIQRQIGLLIDRSGRVVFVLVGDATRIMIPDLTDYRVAAGRLRGLRCIHTHLRGEELSHDDLTDLALLRLDIISAVTLTADGLPRHIHWAHILPDKIHQTPYEVQKPLLPHQLDIGCIELIQALEREMALLQANLRSAGDAERALLVSITTAARKKARESLSELVELSRSAGIEVVDTLLQQRKQIDPRFLMGKGKLNEIAIQAMQQGISLLIFDQELNPSQIRSITDRIELKVIDRTQLILDIFAQRARSREGKLQVELAQLKYLLPHLIAKNTAMSRLTGGIGGRGPGETKLEVNRRRVRQRITHLEKLLTQVQKQRRQQRHKREQRGLPVISIIGYTNAGKSTLLNTLTQSHVHAESRLFATLDPSSRRLRFPKDVEVIITDTVGFIRDLPKDLIVAFRATLEELESADLLLHVIDISNPYYQDHIQSVDTIIADLDLHHIPRILVFNKIDRVDRRSLATVVDRLDGVPVSALDRHSLLPLVARMEAMVTETISTMSLDRTALKSI